MSGGPSTADPVRWAVVGTSDFALQWIAPGIALGADAELAAIVSRDSRRATAAAIRLGVRLSYPSIEAIDTDLVDAVFLVLPAEQHAATTIAAARRGLHVVSEKPMAPSVAACREMIDIADACGVTLAVAQCMEWAPPVVEARRLLATGAIGDVVSATISASVAWDGGHDDDLDRRMDAGRGALIDMGVHAVDALQRLLGPIREVAALVGGGPGHPGGADVSTLLVRFASGAHGTVEAHYACNQNRFAIDGRLGRIWSDQWWGRDFAGDLHLERAGERVDLDLPRVNVYVPQIEHVSACIRTGRTPMISGARGLANIEVLSAAVASAATGRSVTVPGR